MAGKILRGLAAAAGTGLAVGFGGGFSRENPNSSGQVLALEPLLTRMDRLEARVSAVEERPTLESMFEAAIETTVGLHIEGLRGRLQAEMRESLARFETVIDNKISLRISKIEKLLIEQSVAITTLNQRAVDSDGNLQQLISVVERLCARTDRTALGKEPPLFSLPFERQLSEALERAPQPLAKSPDSA